jgi:hypothetical protein
MKKLLMILLISLGCNINVLCSTGSEVAAGLFGFGAGMVTGAMATSTSHHHCCHHCRPLFNSLYDENDLLRSSLYETKKLVRSLKEDNQDLIIDNRDLKAENRELEREIAELRQENKILHKKLRRNSTNEANVRFGIAIDAKG